MKIKLKTIKQNIHYPRQIMSDSTAQAAHTHLGTSVPGMERYFPG